MKNIHVLPTDKSTGIFQSNSGLQFSIRDKVRVEPLKGFHIYITSNEDIKEGDWRCDIELNRIEKGKETGTFKNWKKIILTTDQDLIKDGVRAIGDDFLEWFVKNPSCESVSVNKQYITPLGDVVDFCYDNERLNYKIIIPQEEPKFISGQPFLEKADKVIVIHRPKQETLEEVAERLTENAYQNEEWEKSRLKRIGYYQGLIDGVKWQQEQNKQMFSEEDMKKSFEAGKKGYMRGSYLTQEYYFTWNNFKLWFEQFKKK